jgi:hypothetical protein
VRLAIAPRIRPTDEANAGKWRDHFLSVQWFVMSVLECVRPNSEALYLHQ